MPVRKGGDSCAASEQGTSSNTPAIAYRNMDFSFSSRVPNHYSDRTGWTRSYRGRAARVLSFVVSLSIAKPGVSPHLAFAQPGYESSGNHAIHSKLSSRSTEESMTHLLDATAKGMYAISATPFTDTGEIDWASMESLIEFYVQCGVNGLTILGMMGEAQKLSEDESAELTRRYIRRVEGRVPVIVGVSNAGTANLVKLSKTAMDAGACGVMIAPLMGLKTESQIISYFSDVIAALGDNVPVVYQDYPQSTQAHISAAGFLKIVDAHESVVMFKHEDCPGLRKL